MPKIIFSGNSGAYVTKKRKRMPGTDPSRKPEVKTWDLINPASNKDVYVQYNLLNNTMLGSGEGLPAYTQLSWTPVELQMPAAGNGSTQRIGDRFLWKYLKIKGYVSLQRNLLQPINWRLVLFRVDVGVSTITINRSWYLNHFKMVNTTNVTNLANSNLFCLQNYYLKIANPEDTLAFKRKVIASGTCPSINHATRINNRQAAGTYLASYEFNDDDINAGAGMYLPIDLTVSINDNIVYGNIKYYLLLEVDCGHGWTPTINDTSGDGTSFAVANNPMFLNFICKGYFYDY